MTPPFHGLPTLGQLIDLSGRGAVVTGAAVGIGAAIATRLAEAGADVLLTDIDDQGEETAAALAAQGWSASFRKVDVTVTASVAAAADALATRSPLRVWVNNAGIYPTTGPVLEATDDFVARMLEVNVRAQFSASREAARRMTGGGTIVNLASIAGLRGGAGISAYATSKAAVIGLTRALAAELGPTGIRVNAVAPGVIDTPGVRAQLEPLREMGLDIEQALTANPLRQAGQADLVARVCLFLASDLAAHVTGVTLPVDGGSII